LMKWAALPTYLIHQKNIMPRLRPLDEVVQMAIPLSSCPVKKANEIKKREWLKIQIQLLVEAERNPIINQYGPKEFK
jgi:hypothetical protein